MGLVVRLWAETLYTFVGFGAVYRGSLRIRWSGDLKKREQNEVRTLNFNCADNYDDYCRRGRGGGPNRIYKGTLGGRVSWEARYLFYIR